MLRRRLLFLPIAATAAASVLEDASVRLLPASTTSSAQCATSPGSCLDQWWQIPSQHGSAYAETAGPSSSLTATFIGSEVYVTGWQHRQGALMSVSLDSAEPTIVDTNSTDWWGSLFVARDLDPQMQHTLTVAYASDVPWDSNGPQTLRLTGVVYAPSASPATFGVSLMSSGTSLPFPSNDARPLPIAAIVQGAVGALVILPAAAFMLLTMLRHRNTQHDRRHAADHEADLQPLFAQESGGNSRRSSAGSVLSALPNMAALQTDAAAAAAASSSSHSATMARSTAMATPGRLQPLTEREPWEPESVPLVNVS